MGKYPQVPIKIIASQTIHATTKIYFRVSGAAARTDARSDHAALDFLVTFLSRKK